jgi:hypothetical protein
LISLFDIILIFYAWLKTTSYLKNSRLRSRTRQKPIRRRSNKWAMAGQAQKHSPPEADEHFKEAFNPP